MPSFFPDVLDVLHCLCTRLRATGLAKSMNYFSRQQRPLALEISGASLQLTFPSELAISAGNTYKKLPQPLLYTKLRSFSSQKWCSTCKSVIAREFEVINNDRIQGSQLKSSAVHTTETSSLLRV